MFYHVAGDRRTVVAPLYILYSSYALKPKRLNHIRMEKELEHPKPEDGPTETPGLTQQRPVELTRRLDCSFVEVMPCFLPRTVPLPKKELQLRLCVNFSSRRALAGLSCL